MAVVLEKVAFLDWYTYTGLFHTLGQFLYFRIQKKQTLNLHMVQSYCRKLRQVIMEIQKDDPCASHVFLKYNYKFKVINL